MSYFKNFFSPSKKPGRSSSETKQRLCHDTSTPRTPTKGRYYFPLTPEDSPIEANFSHGLGVKDSRVVKPIGSPRSKRSPSSSKSLSKFLNLLPSIIYKQEDPYDDQNTDPPKNLEGSTLFGYGTPGQSPSQENETTLIGENKAITENEINGKGEKPGEDAKSPIDSVPTQLTDDGYEYIGWSEDEIWLYEKLSNRGYEPLLPKAWESDFPELYESLFSANDPKTFINTVSGKKYRACKELDGLIMLGARVRDRLKAKLSPENTIERQLESYYDWVMTDAEINTMEYIPSICVATAAPGESVTSVVGRITDQLHEVGSQYRTRWIDEEHSDEFEQFYVHDLPTLWGIVIKHSLVSVVTHDTIHPRKAVKCLGVFDLQKGGQDVWHALAIAIIFNRARNDLLMLKAEGEYELAPDIKLSIEDSDL